MRNKLIVIFSFFPLMLLSQNQIWHKTEKEVTELIKGEWKMTSWKYEGSEKMNKDKILGDFVYVKNDSLKLTELIFKNGIREIIESDIDTTIKKNDGNFYILVDYKYKIFGRQIMYIDKSKLILEQGPNIYTYKKVIK